MKPSHLGLAFLSTVIACMPSLPPPPDLLVTSPERGLIQNGEGQVRVTGTALPGSDGSPVSKVTVNNKQAQVGADGSFSVDVAVPEGAMLLETMAYSEDGGRAIDARAVHVGELRPVGSMNEAAIRATLSTEAFGRISEIASQKLAQLDLMSLIPTGQPIASFGNSVANADVTVTQLALASTTFALTPTDAGLEIFIEVSGLSMGARAHYDGALVPEGTTNVSVTADKITITGTLVVTPTADGKLTAKIASPNVSTVAMKLQASGLVGSVLDLLNNNLASTVQKAISSVSEKAIQPGLNAALGALKGPKTIDVLDNTITLEGAFSDVRFSNDGALASLDLAAKLNEPVADYVHTPNGSPKLDMGHGVQVAISDDLINDILAQVHATGKLNVALEKDLGVFDRVSLQMQLPPMLTAQTDDGTVRLILGDMIATATDGDKTLVRAAINATIGVNVEAVSEGQISLTLAEPHVFINLLDDPENPSEFGPDELSRATSSGVGIQIDKLDAILINVPVPTIEGLTFDTFSLRGDSGYMVAGAKLH